MPEQKLPLYVSRKVLNAGEIVEWAKSEGFTTTLPEEELHVTICYSKNPLNWSLLNFNLDTKEIEVEEAEIEVFDGGAVVLKFESDYLKLRHEYFVQNGASFDFDEYNPHITLSYNEVEPEVKTYPAKIVLGPEVAETINENYKDTLVEKAEYQGKQVTLDKPFRLPSGSSKKFGVYVKDGDKVKKVTFGDPNMEIKRDDPDARASFRARHSCDTAKDKTSAQYWSCRMWDKDVSVSEMTKSEVFDDQVISTSSVLKVFEEQRIVYGWASVVTKSGEPVVDLHGDIITPVEMQKAANSFMQSARTAKAMHKGAGVGEIIHSLPLTEELAKSLGIETDQEGWIIGMKIHDDNIWKRVKSGELSEFSIGGKGLRNAL